MPKGPNGQSRPADVIGAAVLVGRIATGEADETAVRAPRGRSGGVARAATLSVQERVQIASTGAEARWDSNERRERKMSIATPRGASAAEGSALRMYPNNQLGKQYRDISESLSIFEVSSKYFYSKK